MSRVILCQVVRESRSFSLIFTFCIVVSEDFFVHGPIKYEQFLNSSI